MGSNVHQRLSGGQDRKEPVMARRGDGLYQAKNGSWKLDCWIHGQRIRKSFGRIAEKLARDLATAERAAMLRGQAGILPPTRRDVTFERAVREFRERHLPSLRETTRRAYGQELDRLAAHFGNVRLSQIGALAIEGYRKARTKDHTRARVRCNREVERLRSLFHRMIAWGLYEGEVPIRKLAGKRTVGRYEESRGRERVLTPAEEGRLLAALREPYRTLVLLGLHTGVRLRSEGLSLTWQDVDLERGRLTVRGEVAKNGEPRTIPLSVPLREALTRLHAEATGLGAVFTTRQGRELRGVRSVIWRAAERAKVLGVSPHVLRHTWATRFMQSGGDLSTLRRLGGWKRIEMVQRYAHSDDAHAARAVERMVAAFAVPAKSTAGEEVVALTPRRVVGIGAGTQAS